MKITYSKKYILNMWFSNISNVTKRILKRNVKRYFYPIILQPLSFFWKWKRARFSGTKMNIFFFLSHYPFQQYYCQIKYEKYAWFAGTKVNDFFFCHATLLAISGVAIAIAILQAHKSCILLDFLIIKLSVIRFFQTFIGFASR